MLNEVDIVVVTFNSADVLGEMLASLHDAPPPVVVDNASKDETRAIAARQGASVIANPENLGFGRACNQGARAGSKPFILFLNPDCILTAGALLELLAVASRSLLHGAFNPQLTDEAGKMSFKAESLLAPGERISRPPTETGDALFLSGAALLVRRAVFEEIGGFDENIFLYYEDDDLCRRIRDRGWRLLHVHSAVFKHKGGKSSGASPEVIRFKAREAIVSQHYVSRKYGIAFHSRRKLVSAWLRRRLMFASGASEKPAKLEGRIEGLMRILSGASGASPQ